VNLGLFGGTFNPIHNGHLRAAEEACEALGLDRLLFVPAMLPPHKRNAELADADLRLRLVRAAIRGNPRFGVSAAELRRVGPSYSVDTLAEFRGRRGTERLWFVMGADQFRDIRTWHRYREIFALADIAVLSRPPDTAMPPPPAELAGDLAPHAGGYRHASGREVRFVPITPLAISSTDVRRALREGRSIRYLVPEAVRRVLEQT